MEQILNVDTFIPLINKNLNFLHPNLNITDEAVDWLVRMFGKYIDMKVNDIILFLPDEFEQHASDQAMKNKGKQHQAVIDYLLAETLELSGNRARDMKKKIITPYHICLAVETDMMDIFDKPNIPIVVQQSELHGKKGVFSKAKLKKKLMEHGIQSNQSDDAFIAILNILNAVALSPRYTSESDVSAKIRKIGGMYDAKAGYYIAQLQYALLDRLFDLIDNTNICFTIINTIVGNAKDTFEYLFDH